MTRQYYTTGIKNKYNNILECYDELSYYKITLDTYNLIQIKVVTLHMNVIKMKFRMDCDEVIVNKIIRNEVRKLDELNGI